MTALVTLKEGIVINRHDIKGTKTKKNEVFNSLGPNDTYMLQQTG